MPRAKLPRKELPWSANLSYVVGLITTDGNLSSDKRHISITSTDKQLLRTVLTCLGKKNTISKNPPGAIFKKQAYRIQIGDVNLYDWLLSIGLFPNKSLTLGGLKVDLNFFPDFLRGHLDGDGSIIHYKDRYNTKIKETYVYDRLFVYFGSASKKHIEWLRNNIYLLKGPRGSLNSVQSKTQKGKSTIFRLKYSTKEAKIILNWIYYKPRLPCLQRKYKIAQPFLIN